MLTKANFYWEMTTLSSIMIPIYHAVHALSEAMSSLTEDLKIGSAAKIPTQLVSQDTPSVPTPVSTKTSFNSFTPSVTIQL